MPRPSARPPRTCLPLGRPLLTPLAAALLALACGGAPAAEALDAAERAGAVAQQPAARHDSTFARTIARLSEPGGYFDTDNLVSNETSVLHVMAALERRGVRGGAYVGVGPEQNFSYIAAVRPEVAFIVDIRRDNLLQQLWYKALFGLARNRAEFLLLLTGRPVPADVARWTDGDIEEIVRLVDRTEPTAASAGRARSRVVAAVRATGVPLDSADLATVDRIHRAFVAEGLSLRFTSHGRGPRPGYPTLRDIVLARDQHVRRVGYLSTEERFRTVQALQAADRVIPVVGDLAGRHALRAIGEEVARRGQRVSMLYTSNVEFYLAREGTFDAFARNVAALPRDPRGVLVRSCFGFACGPGHPNALSGHQSVQMAQGLDDFVAAHEAGELATYEDVVRRRLLPP